MLDDFKVLMTDEEVQNASYVDLAYEILRSSGNTFHYKDLLLEIGRRKGLAQENLENVMATIYSEINIDGRFVAAGQNVWGLKRWYPSEKQSKTGPIPKRFKRNDDDYDDYDLDDDFYMDDDYSPDIEDEDNDINDGFDDIDAIDDDADDFVIGTDDEDVPADLEDDLDEDLADELDPDLDDDFNDDDVDDEDELFEDDEDDDR
ncbi:DNA-directed RNA polymerase subunit delta [Desulfuribacillus stibiiarsenatis]|uniref:Probable DNA-directed RNA polymerase subunit delta n=1 Tax=Desulfuribacillus stibiiarsenatis TaxID=1390249 RepID=A0A1E5L5K4_9FIRM|nr:DNA-directed RNA polymerase subunit delta [Desulfuribacillus stibiiarsenatis]OEH85415.1 DNA-directed RNA polymerase subunit delta [Desulfuribacillus stibiiarsenatis]